MKFAHLADCHIGAWRQEDMRRLVSEAFSQAISQCIAENVDFVLIAGDLFNTAVPSIDAMHAAVGEFSRLKDKNIPVYVIAGSHDYAASGKSMLDVLAAAGLLVNVFSGQMDEDGTLALNLTIDEKTGAQITGIPGKAGMLDKKLYHKLAALNVDERKPSIFMFHTAISELMREKRFIKFSEPLSLLPKHFTYYAGGHVHIITDMKEPGYNRIVYPGALFPANFGELEEFSHGGFFIYDTVTDVLTRKEVVIKKHKALTLDVSQKDAQTIRNELTNLAKQEVQDMIVTLRVRGLLDFPVSELQLNDFSNTLKAKGAYAVLRHTAGIQLPEFEAVDNDQLKPEEVEQTVIESHLDELKTKDIENPAATVKALLDVLSTEKVEGETKTDYEQRIVNQTKRILDY